MRRFLFPAACSLIVLVSTPAAAKKLAWDLLGATELQAGQGDIAWRASLFEAHNPERRSAWQQGDTDPGGSRRQLVLEVFDVASNVLLRQEVIPAPQRVHPGDACSVTEWTQLEAEGTRLALGFDHTFACGAGAGTTASYRIEIGRRDSRLVAFEWTSASRDAIASVRIDYLAGRLSTATDRPEDETPRPPRVRTIRPGGIPLTPRLLLGCPAPLRGDDVPACRAR